MTQPIYATVPKKSLLIREFRPKLPNRIYRISLPEMLLITLFAEKMGSAISIHEPFPEPSTGRRFDELTERERGFFVGDEYLPLSPNHCERIKLLSRVDALRIWDWMPLRHRNFWPSPKPTFTHQDSLLLKWDRDEDPEVRDWLWGRGIPFGREIFILHDDRRTVIQTDWKMLVRYWDAFSWSVGVEALVIDRSLTWCCHLHHESVLIFETFDKANKP